MPPPFAGDGLVPRQEGEPSRSSAVLDLGPIVPGTGSLPRQRSRFDRGFAAGVLIAAALHLGALASTLAPSTRDVLGTGGQTLDAISVEISLVPASGSDATPAAAAPEPTPPTPDAPSTPVTTTAALQPPKDADKPPELQPLEPKPREDAPPPVVIAKPDPSPPTDAPVLPVAELPPPDAKPAQTLDKPREPVKEKAAEPPSREAPAPSPTEAVLAPAIAATPSRGTARPSDGQMQAFAKAVSTALRKAPPKPLRGTTGEVHVVFRVSEDGGFAFVRVLKSSGRPDLDAATLASVRRVKVPPPPPGMTDDERTYSIGYSF